MHAQRVFRGCSHSSKVFTRIQLHSGHVQYSLKGVQVHSIVFRGCSILTHRCSRAFTRVQGAFSSDTNAIFLMVTPWWVAFNNDSMALMRTQWVFNTHSLAFMRTQCVFRGCSHSLIGVHAHSMGVQGLFNTHSLVSTCTHKCSGHVQFWLKCDLSHGHTMVSRIQ